MLRPKKPKLKKLRDNLYSVAHLPRVWFAEHVRGSICGCILGKPKIGCDVGEALYKLQCKEDARWFWKT